MGFSKKMLPGFFTYTALVIGLLSCSSRPAPEQSPTPMRYAPVGYGDEGYELTENIDKGTPITLVNHLTGEVSLTHSSDAGSKTDYMGDRYEYSALESQPSWPIPENTFRQNMATTAIMGQHLEEIKTIDPKLVKNSSLTTKIDERIRSQSLLDSTMMSLGENEETIGYYRDQLADMLPELYQVRFEGRKITLVSYDYAFSESSFRMGPKFIIENDKLFPLLGNCAFMPQFYSVNGHLYFRHITSRCETGHILVENYVIIADGAKREWNTFAYAN